MSSVASEYFKLHQELQDVRSQMSNLVYRENLLKEKTEELEDKLEESTPGRSKVYIVNNGRHAVSVHFNSEMGAHEIEVLAAD